MKLPGKAVIAREKVTRFLLVRLSRGDKSGFLERGGFTETNPDALIATLERLAIEGEARLVDDNKFGRYYEISGTLYGPNGTLLHVKTIWMVEHLSRTAKFITLIPVGTVRS